MARPALLIVIAYPDPMIDRPYPVRVLPVTSQNRQRLLAVALEHLDSEQAGRQFEVPLSLPCRPAGLTASFMAACGHSIEIGATLPVKDCIGKTVMVRFQRTASGEFEPTSFEPPPGDHPCPAAHSPT